MNRGYIFSDKALNNLMYYRRCQFILVYQNKNNEIVRYRIFPQRKKALLFHRDAMRDTKLKCYLIRLFPNHYKPKGLIQ